MCIACIWYVSHTTSAYVLHICMYHLCLYGICTYMHTSNCFQSRWWALAHCRMITVTDILKALKQIQHTHGFVTRLKKVLDCFNVQTPGSLLPYHGLPSVHELMSYSRLPDPGWPIRSHLPPGKARILVTGHALGNGASITCG